MHSFAVALAFASGVGAARIQVDTAEAEALSLTSPQFPNPVIIRNGVMQWRSDTPSRDADAPQLLFASASGHNPMVTPPEWRMQRLATVMENVGATHTEELYRERVSESFFWVIQPHPGTSAFTICNPHNCRCLFATDERTVGASGLEFQEDQLWMIEPTDANDQRYGGFAPYTITHMISGLRLYRGGMSRNEFGIGDDASGHRERVWRDQTWYIEDRADYCRDADCAASDPNPGCLLPPVPPTAQSVSFPDPVNIASVMHGNRALYALSSTDGEHEGLGAGELPHYGGPGVGQRFFWVIQQHQGGSDFTICNPHSSRCLFATDQGVVGATEGSFRGDDQLWIIRATSGPPQGLLEDLTTYTITNKANGQRLFADEYDSYNEQTHDEQGWGTTSTGKIDQLWLILNLCEGREPLNCVDTE